MNETRIYHLDNNGAAIGITVKDARKVLSLLANQGHAKDTIESILNMLNRFDFKQGDNCPLVNLL